MVRDPGSGTAYYTTDIDKAGSAVTLQNSEVREISKDDFTKGLTAPAPVPAAAAAAPAPTVVTVPAPVAVPAPAAAGASAPAPQ
jgi:hypothetical protein